MAVFLSFNVTFTNSCHQYHCCSVEGYQWLFWQFLSPSVESSCPGQCTVHKPVCNVSNQNVFLLQRSNRKQSNSSRVEILNDHVRLFVMQPCINNGFYTLKFQSFFYILNLVSTHKNGTTAQPDAKLYN